MSVMKTLTINGRTFTVTPVVPTDSVTLLASAWEAGDGKYHQVVELSGVTPHTKVDLQPTPKQLVEFHDKVLGFVAENDGGTVTVFAIGDKPTNDHTIQITMTEVDATGKIRGNTVGTTTPRSNWAQTDPTKADYIMNKPNELSAGSGGFVVNDTPPEDTTVLWIDTSDDTEDGDTEDGTGLTLEEMQTIALMAAEMVEVPEGGGIALTGAVPGQLARISAVDENGVPTAWEPVSTPGQELLLLETTTEIPQDTPVSVLEWELPPSAKYCDSFFIELYGAKPTNEPANGVRMQVNMCGNNLYGGSASNGAVRNNNQNWIQIHCDFVRRLVVNLVYNNAPKSNSNISMSAWTLYTVLPAENRTNVLRVKLSEAYAGTISATVRGYTGWEVPGDA